MAKDKEPAILLYFRDFLTSTDLMTNEQVGAHIRILCHQADKGHLPEEAISGRIGGPIWDSIRDRYMMDPDGLWYHPRMEKVISERARYVKNRLSNLHKNVPYEEPTREPHVGGSPSPSPSPSPHASKKEEKNKPGKARSDVWLEIGGQKVSYASRQKIITMVGDFHQAGLVFYRCIQAAPKNPAAWIMAGVTGKEKYALKACADEFDNKKAVQSWMDQHWNKKGPQSVGAILNEMRKS